MWRFVFCDSIVNSSPNPSAAVWSHKGNVVRSFAFKEETCSNACLLHRHFTQTHTHTCTDTQLHSSMPYTQTFALGELLHPLFRLVVKTEMCKAAPATAACHLSKGSARGCFCSREFRECQPCRASRWRSCAFFTVRDGGWTPFTNKGEEKK